MSASQANAGPRRTYCPATKAPQLLQQVGGQAVQGDALGQGTVPVHDDPGRLDAPVDALLNPHEGRSVELAVDDGAEDGTASQLLDGRHDGDLVQRREAKVLVGQRIAHPGPKGVGARAGHRDDVDLAGAGHVTADVGEAGPAVRRGGQGDGHGPLAHDRCQVVIGTAVGGRVVTHDRVARVVVGKEVVVLVVVMAGGRDRRGSIHASPVGGVRRWLSPCHGLMGGRRWRRARRAQWWMAAGGGRGVVVGGGGGPHRPAESRGRSGTGSGRGRPVHGAVARWRKEGEGNTTGQQDIREGERCTDEAQRRREREREERGVVQRSGMTAKRAPSAGPGCESAMMVVVVLAGGMSWKGGQVVSLASQWPLCLPRLVKSR